MAIVVFDGSQAYKKNLIHYLTQQPVDYIYLIMSLEAFLMKQIQTYALQF